jgi:serine/threonine-protein kinase RsbW
MTSGSDENRARSPRTKAAVRLHRFPDDLVPVSEEILSAITSCDYPDASTFALRLVIEEAVSNAFKHGNRGRPDAHVDIEWEIKPDQVLISVEDQGEGFDPESLPDPTDEDRLELPSGRGVLLIHAYMSDVQYNDRGNRVTMTYRNPG